MAREISEAQIHVCKRWVETLADIQSEKDGDLDFGLIQRTSKASDYPVGMKEDLANDILIWDLRGWKMAKKIETLLFFTMSDG